MLGRLSHNLHVKAICLTFASLPFFFFLRSCCVCLQNEYYSVKCPQCVCVCLPTVAFLFNWIGFCLSFCLTNTIAGRYGAICGFGLSLIKWILIVRVRASRPQIFWKKLSIPNVSSRTTSCCFRDTKYQHAVRKPNPLLLSLWNMRGAKERVEPDLKRLRNKVATTVCGYITASALAWLGQEADTCPGVLPGHMTGWEGHLEPEPRFSGINQNPLCHLHTGRGTPDPPLSAGRDLVRSPGLDP